MTMSESATYINRLNDTSPSKNDEPIVLSHDGCIIYIGQNALSNERIIATHAHKECLAIHAWGAKGSWVVLCHGVSNTPFTDDRIRFAAETAIKHTPTAEIRSVIFSRVSDLYKPEGSRDGVFRSNRQERIDL